ncbi:O-antigen polymerase [Neobacillus niacini]|uniref:O-antigen polymerase n=1 Tax=Neobacillus niacini TaxID=86668 RepID=UPI0021CB19A5|nr:O-antigen polymerase [Neobacillus niacini]MCM3763504.1 oligosaccharide repeat unit polymerase [Neobacillus niacini]
MINPYFIYILSFLAVLIAYLFRWSNLFPDLGLPLILFLGSSMAVAFFLGRIFVKQKIISFNNIKYKKNLELVTYGVLTGYLLEFLYHRNFPLLAMFTNTQLSYTEFGIPTFHVLLVTFNSFFSLYLFQIVLSESERRKISLVLFILTLVPSILILNRGMLLIILMSCVFIYLIKYQSKITFNKIAGLTVLMVIGLYLFGVLGNMRVNNSYQTNTSLFDNSLFLQIGGATNEFKDSVIPKEFFWGYIYLASPLANLQETINNFTFEEDVNFYDTFVFTITQTLPDFISKRVVPLYNMVIPAGYQITPELNVSTAFAQPFVLLGWVGITFYTIFAFVFALFYILLLKKLNSDYMIIGIAIMNSIFVFTTFSNMFSFTGLSFQLVYPLLFTLFSEKKFIPKAVSDEDNLSNSGV